MKLHATLFCAGALMIAYDLAGHACCLVARCNQTAAALWNAHSAKIWPSIKDGVAYDFYWSTFFAGALMLMITGYLLKR